ncbi:MAG: TonB-dependent receptor [Spirochaetia bacterium]|nr:TonB-dependent receptor [Spirochaetota bacterium]MCX8097036.1 TonB-dependent receptor [Spirochaetota bacterium]MDW8111769.1 TonB-dependent receptor [Spirochaetia bacterium]
MRGLARLLIAMLMATIMVAYVFAEEQTNTNEVQNAPQTNVVQKDSLKTLSPLVFETTVIGSVWERETSASTMDVRKYKKKGDSPDFTDYFQNIPDTLTPTYYGMIGHVVNIFTPRGDKVNIAVNGIDISTAANSSYDVSVLDPLFFESLEIYYGPSSARYGGGNYGGVVNFNLLGDEKKNFIRVIRTLGASFETYYVMSDLSLITDFGKFYLGVSYNRSENIFNFNVSTLYTNQSSLEPTNYVRQGAEHTKYSGLFRYISEVFGIMLDTGVLLTLPTTHEPNQVQKNNPLDYEKAESRIRFILPYIKANYKMDLTELGFKLYYTEQLRNRKVEKLLSPFGGSIGSKILASKVGAEFDVKQRIDIDTMNAVLLGLALNYISDGYDVVNTNSSTFPSTNTNESKTNASRNIIGVYLEGNYLLSSLLQLTASSRFDLIDANIFELSPRIGVLVKPTEFLGIRTSVWRAYRLPYFDDVYGPVAYGYGPNVLTNLKTEYVNGIDASIIFDYKIGDFGIYLSLTPYYSDTTNLIAFNNATFTTENIGKVFTRGINSQFKLSFRDTLTSTISYTYNESINGNASEFIGWSRLVFLSHRPLNSLYIDIVYERGYFGLGAYLNYFWNRFGYVYDSAFNIIGNRTFDDILTLSIKHWARPKEWVELGVEWKRNLIGNEYVEGYPIPEEKINTYVIFEFSW